MAFNKKYEPVTASAEPYNGPEIQIAYNTESILNQFSTKLFVCLFVLEVLCPSRHY